MGTTILRWVSLGLLALLASCGGGGGGGDGGSPAGGSSPPTAFAFAPQTDTQRSAVVTSNPVVIAGLSSASTVSITGGEYSIDGGAYTSAPGTISNGQTIRVRATTPQSYSATITVVLTVGGVSASFVVTTAPPDITPDAIQFQPQLNVARGQWATSNAITVSGIEVPAPISIEGGEYSIDGSAFTTTAGTISASQSLKIRAQASAVYSKVVHARVTVGTIVADFEAMSEVPDFVPDRLDFDGHDVIYLLSKNNQLVFRWSISQERYLDAYELGPNSQNLTTLTYSSAQQRLYLGYSTGAIQYVDVATGTGGEVPFATTAMAVNGLSAVGNYLLAQDGSGAWATHYVFNASGALTAQKDWNRYSSEYAWDPVTSRVYFFRDGTSPNDLHYEVIDQVTGQITSEGETPYHGDYFIQPPIRVSANGQFVLLGSGDIYNQSGLTWARSIGTQVADARWFADGSLVTLLTASNQTTLRRLSGTTVLEQRSFTGQALRVVGSDSKMAVLVANNGAVQFHVYVPSNDSDGDGVSNTSDAFPLDAAASVDTDHDGHPDSWNAGKSQSDSTTGLTLDAYPNDSACYLVSHGSGGNCNYASTVPNYVPDQIVSAGDTIFLLSSANKRVYRWSMATGEYLNPYAVGIDQGFGTVAPTKMAYSAAHQRLYLGYSTGAIQYVDVTAGTGPEVPFATTAMGVQRPGGRRQLPAGAGWQRRMGHALCVQRQRRDHRSSGLEPLLEEYAWDPVNSRVYFFRDTTSPNDLHYEVIDQATGQITSAGETPYHGDYYIEPPIRVSTDGERVLLGAGDIYHRNGLTWVGSLGKTITDAQWVDNLLVDVDTTDKVEIRDARTRAVLRSYQYLGQPLRIVFGTTDAYLVHVVSNSTMFLKLLPFGDQDNDSIPLWWEQLYGLSDSNAADAAGDLDSDGVSNVDEYLNHANPTVADTDADGLSDIQEIATYSTDPARADSDDDGLSDQAEVITYNTDPWDKDSDNDGYSDQDEVLYGGDPNDPSGLPQPLLNYSESFEGGTIPAGWSTPATSNVPWAIDSTVAASGTQSLKAGDLTGQAVSSIRYRAVFSNGQLSFQARLDSSCCERVVVLLDGVEQTYLYGNTPWTTRTIPVGPGVHEVEWRFQRDYFSSNPAGSAWLDNVSFVGH